MSERGTELWVIPHEHREAFESLLMAAGIDVKRAIVDPEKFWVKDGFLAWPVGDATFQVCMKLQHEHMIKRSMFLKLPRGHA